jgi:hypothetical protein
LTDLGPPHRSKRGVGFADLGFADLGFAHNAIYYGNAARREALASTSP